MARTTTTQLSTFTRAGHVTYKFSQPPGHSLRTIIILPTGSKWTSGLHWHETHVEYLRIVRGKVRVLHEDKGGKMIDHIVRAGAELEVPKFARHEWMRADFQENEDDDAGVKENEDEDQEVVVEEWTEPSDGMKESFFRNLSGVIDDWGKEKKGSFRATEMWLNWQLFIVFYELDNWPVVWGQSRFVQWVVVHALLITAAFAGKLVGLKGMYDEYTPAVIARRNID